MLQFNKAKCIFDINFLFISFGYLIESGCSETVGKSSRKYVNLNVLRIFKNINLFWGMEIH